MDTKQLSIIIIIILMYLVSKQDYLCMAIKCLCCPRLIKIGNAIIIATINSLICTSSVKSIEIQLQLATHNTRIIVCPRRCHKKRRRVIKTWAIGAAVLLPGRAPFAVATVEPRQRPTSFVSGTEKFPSDNSILKSGECANKDELGARCI
jgi:hypothetical protein